jgi:hypothetical protein
MVAPSRSRRLAGLCGRPILTATTCNTSTDVAALGHCQVKWNARYGKLRSIAPPYRMTVVRSQLSGRAHRAILLH